MQESKNIDQIYFSSPWKGVKNRFGGKFKSLRIIWYTDSYKKSDDLGNYLISPSNIIQCRLSS